MARKIIPLVTGERYHVFNRGVEKRVVFNSKDDYLRFYRSLLFFNSEEPVLSFRDAERGHRVRSNSLVEIEAYSLLPNHFHLLIKQVIEGGVSEFMKRVSAGYTNYFNEKYNRSGTLFQGKFKRVHIETDEQYEYLFAYINENHFVHGFDTERQICHSSSLHYQGLSQSKLITNDNQRKYNFAENVKFALATYNQRTTLKKSLLEE